MLGLLFYGQLLAVLIWRGPNRYSSACTLVAVAIHGALMILLLSRRIMCPSCLLTAAGACAMLAIQCALEPRTWRRAALIWPMAAAVMLAGRFALKAPYVRLREQRRQVMVRQQFELALEREAREPPVAAGCVRILVYWEPTCPSCRALEAKVMPVIRREMGSRLEVVHRRPWNGIMTPTLIIRGRERTQFVGLPTVAQLREAITVARGRHVQSRVTSRASRVGTSRS
jgi:protein-disulfide isomerase